MGGTQGSGAPQTVFTFKGLATLDQANPVQNTWYTILNGKNVQLHGLLIRVATTGETLEVKFTIDGQTATGTQVANADTNYYATLLFNHGGFAFTVGTTNYPFLMNYNSLIGKSVLLEVRKTTNTGAGNLKGWALYSQR